MTHIAPAVTSRRRTWFLLAGLVVVVVAVIAAVVARNGGSAEKPRAAATPTATQAEVAPVGTFTGTGPQTTKKFRAELNWQLRWSAPANSGFAVELLNNKGASLGTIVAGGKRSSGTTFVSQAGTFQLKVTDKRSWKIEVLSTPSK